MYNQPENCIRCGASDLGSDTAPSGMVYKCRACGASWPAYMDDEDARQHVRSWYGDVNETLEACINLMVEQRVREADISDGSRVPHGSSKHIKDLEVRIADLIRWRDRQKRGTEARANYSRLITRLRGELASARRQAAKRVKRGP